MVLKKKKGNENETKDNCVAVRCTRIFLVSTCPLPQHHHHALVYYIVNVYSCCQGTAATIVSTETFLVVVFYALRPTTTVSPLLPLRVYHTLLFPRRILLQQQFSRPPRIYISIALPHSPPSPSLSPLTLSLSHCPLHCRHRPSGWRYSFRRQFSLFPAYCSRPALPRLFSNTMCCALQLYRRRRRRRRAHAGHRHVFAWEK